MQRAMILSMTNTHIHTHDYSNGCALLVYKFVFQRRVRPSFVWEDLINLHQEAPFSYR